MSASSSAAPSSTLRPLTVGEQRLRALYVASVPVSAAVLLGVAMLVQPPDRGALPLLAALLVAQLLLERMHVDLFGEGRVSMGFVGLFAAALTLDPALAALSGLAATLLARLATRTPLSKAALSAGAVGLSGLAGALILHHAVQDPTSSRFLLQVPLVALAGLLMFGFNSGLVAVAIALHTLEKPVAVWNEKFRWLAPHYALFAATAYAVVVALRDVGALGAVVFSIPVVATWLVAKQYAARAAADVQRIQDGAVEVRRSEERFRLLVERAPGLIAVIGRDGRVGGLYSEGGEDLRAPSIYDLVHPADHDALRRSIDSVAWPGMSSDLEVRMKDRGGEWRDYLAVLRDVTDSGAVAGLVLNGHDITERKQLEERLRHQAYHDPLTVLPNRLAFEQRLDEVVREHAGTSSLGVMFLDLDRFKAVNDTFGHQIGDDLLIEVAARLATCLGPRDLLARFGGDEFTVLAPDVDGPDGAMAMAQTLLAALEAPVELHGWRTYVRASIGVATLEPGGRNWSARELLRSADVAVARAKEEGRGRARLFSDDLDPYSVDKFQLEVDLREAVGRGELRAVYQPEVDIATGEAVGVESLVRWRHPQRGPLSPATFIQLAEETGEIVRIGRWMLETACADLARWRAEGLVGETFTVAVNLSAQEFFQTDLVPYIAGVLRRTALPAPCLRIEITESLLMSDSDQTHRMIEALRALGIEIAIDDFGTGYSSLSYLSRLPFDVLKVDRAFIDAIETQPQQLAIVTAIIAMSSAIGVRLTVEGIERDSQAALLLEAHAERAQGYLYARPMPARDLEQYLRPTSATAA